jgi:hypothetical protein
MYSYEKHLISYIILEKLNEEYGDCYGRRTLIHLLCALAGGNLENLLTINTQNNIKIEHAARASKSKYGIEKIENFQMHVEGEILSFSYNLIREGRETIIREGDSCQINNILPELDSNNVLIQRGLNSTEREREALYWNLKKIANTANYIDENNVHPKIIALHSLLTTLSSDNELVAQITNEEDPSVGERFLQTVIGAALFYCPSNVNHWDNKISLEALRNKVFENGRVAKDHKNPRRKGAIQLMTDFTSRHMNVNELEVYYETNLAPYTIVTSAENRRLTNYFLEHDDYQEALLANGIEMIPANEERFINNAELKRFVEYLRREYNNNVLFNSHYVHHMLIEFRNLDE